MSNFEQVLLDAVSNGEVSLQAAQEAVRDAGLDWQHRTFTRMKKQGAVKAIVKASGDGSPSVFIRSGGDA